jgi:hypothetical protein
MNGSTENRTFEKGSGRDIVLTWSAACRMLPLVHRIVADLLQLRRHLASLLPEKERLDRKRRLLAWPERRRRYGLQEEITQAEQDQTLALAELESLGLAIVDAERGQIGFPTMVNNRRAFFSWRPGEESIQFWHFAEDVERRSIPPMWTGNTEVRSRSKS